MSLSHCGMRGSCLHILKRLEVPSCGPAGRTCPECGCSRCSPPVLPAGPARREASRAVSCWALLSVPALIGGAGAPMPLPVHLPGTRCLGHPRPTMVVALPLWPLSSPGVRLRPRNHHTKSAGCLGVCLVAFVSASPVLSLDRPRVRSWPSLRPLGQAVQSRGWAASGNVLRFWCPRGLGRATLAVTPHLQVGLAWLARPWRLFLQMPVPAVGAGGL